ncbi:hypothetical protein D9M71_828040 [compost metagenome]
MDHHPGPIVFHRHAGDPIPHHAHLERTAAIDDQYPAHAVGFQRIQNRQVIFVGPDGCALSVKAHAAAIATELQLADMQSLVVEIVKIGGGHFHRHVAFSWREWL